MSRLILAFLMAFPGLAFAAPNTMLCEMIEGDLQGYKLLFQHDPASRQMLVYDAAVMENVGEPVPASVSVDNARRISFSWELDYKSKTSRFRLAFNATYRKADSYLTLTAQPIAYDNSYSSAGRCRPV